MDIQVVKLVQEFNQTNNWGIKVEAWPMGGSAALFESLENPAPGSSLPNVVVASTDQLQVLQAKSIVFVDLNDYLFAPNWGMTPADAEDFIPVFWQQDQMEGIRLGIAANRTMQVLFYNQTWAEQLGFKQAPSTPQDFADQACAAAQSNLKDAPRANDGTGGWIIDTSPLTIINWLAAFDSSPVPGRAGAPYQFEQTGSTETFTFLRKLYDQNCAWHSRNPTPYEYFLTRQALFYSGTLQDISSQTRVQLLLKNNERWSILPYPSSDKKGKVISSGGSYAILKGKTAEQLASWLFIRWMSHPENQARLALAGNFIPVGKTALNLARTGSTLYPQLAQAYILTDFSLPAPGLASWRIARKVLEDAASQLFQPLQTGAKPDIPGTLIQLDEIIQDLTS
jgi:multiple sugar transport system substrate-binding protein